ncbi:TetR-family transcriptional regulator [Amycolatopsis camponoti]|uniref:TetR-family transcriptional regulator n=1 Tax=Amycolatopsis camponoti TaxID=2606593 RepID=A0A6I8LRT7_9PSEU|nr:TetR family transcriptional regulator [Amycolatopsis camponoti]VVJ17809.1 TetR-family transcriptional regulator [Amycolatopsis camponoti]
MTQPRQRARSDQDKEVRKTALLTAARELAAERGVREVTLTEVTSRVGLHPSALRRYFESREELLLELAQQGWADWRERLLADLAGRRLGPIEVAEVVAGSLDALPLFCDLQTHVGLSLEGAVRLERARDYKTAASEAFDAMTAALVETGAGLDPEGARTLLTAAMSCAAYLFQLSRPSPTLRRLYDEVPRWAHSALRFREQLTTLLRAVALGVHRPAEPT